MPIYIHKFTNSVIFVILVILVQQKELQFTAEPLRDTAAINTDGSYNKKDCFEKDNRIYFQSQNRNMI